MDRYEYGTVEKADYIAGHVAYERMYAVKHMRFRREDDKKFALACLDYFHRHSPIRLTEEAMTVCIDLLPEEEWRQGMSSHRLHVWPDDVTKDSLLYDGYIGSKGREVAGCKHGMLTWFCIMSYAFVKAEKAKRKANEDA